MEFSGRIYQKKAIRKLPLGLGWRVKQIWGLLNVIHIS
jgi:hypothetical protein